MACPVTGLIYYTLADLVKKGAHSCRVKKRHAKAGPEDLRNDEAMVDGGRAGREAKREFSRLARPGITQGDSPTHGRPSGDDHGTGRIRTSSAAYRKASDRATIDPTVADLRNASLEVRCSCHATPFTATIASLAIETGRRRGAGSWRLEY